MRAEIVGIPVFLYGVNLGDSVRLMKSAERADVVTAVVSDGGNFTFRALFERESHPGEHWQRLMNDLAPLGCWFDAWSETVIAISAATADADVVRD